MPRGRLKTLSVEDRQAFASAGGAARALALSASKRKAIAKLAAKIRWKRQPNKSAQVDGEV